MLRCGRIRLLLLNKCAKADLSPDATVTVAEFKKQSLAKVKVCNQSIVFVDIYVDRKLLVVKLPILFFLDFLYHEFFTCQTLVFLSCFLISSNRSNNCTYAPEFA